MLVASIVHDEIQVLEEAPDRVERQPGVDIEFVVADAQVLKVDHAAAERRRVVDADERGVIAEPREVVDLGAVAEHADVRRDRLRVQHLAGEGLDHQPDGMRDLGCVARDGGAFEIDELDVPPDLDRAVGGDHRQVDRLRRLRARVDQREGQFQATLVQVALQAVQGPDVARRRRVFEGLHQPAHTHRQRVARGAGERLERARAQIRMHPHQGLRVGACRAVGRAAEERLEIGHEPRGLVENAVEPPAGERSHVENVVEQVRVDDVVGAEAGEGVGLLRGRRGFAMARLLAAGAPAGGDDQHALEHAPGAGQVGDERRLIVREQQRESVREAHGNHAPGLDAEVHSGPSQGRDDLAHHALAEHLGRPAE